jgi:hypothetical protein
LVACGGGTEAECTEAAMQCDGMMVQTCTEGVWAEAMDCDEGQECMEMDDGSSMCMDMEDTSMPME